MKIYYYHDRVTHKALNDKGCDYTPAYIPIILKNLGFSSYELTPDSLALLQKGDVLIMGADTLKDTGMLTDAILRECSIIAFDTKADGIFPKTNLIKKGNSEYDIVGYFNFLDSREPLPVLSAFGAINTAENALGVIENHTAFAKIADRIWYFSFDLMATLLYSANGKPTIDGQNGFSIGRLVDGCVLEPDYDFDIAYNDSYLRAIEDILCDLGFARVWALPVTNGKVCDMALYFAGDDDAYSKENDLRAAENMHKRGLPYHLNLMPKKDGTFVLSREDVQKLHSLGCETAIHYDFTVFPYTLEGHKTQMQMYEKAFGKSGGPVNHCLVQVGSAPERYMMQIECGAKSDNNRFQNKVNPYNINAFNLVGYGFGHAFPRFCMADAKNQNIPLEFCELYMSYYEPRIINGTRQEYEKIEKYLDDSFYYGRTSQLFTHPHYISGVTKYDPNHTLRALDYAKEYVTQKGWNVWYTAPDTLCNWWHMRARCKISNVTDSGFEINNATDKNVSVVLPQRKTDVFINGKSVTPTKKQVGGREIYIICVESGTHQVKYNTTPSLVK